MANNVDWTMGPSSFADKIIKYPDRLEIYVNGGLILVSIRDYQLQVKMNTNIRVPSELSTTKTSEGSGTSVSSLQSDRISQETVVAELDAQGVS